METKTKIVEPDEHNVVHDTVILALSGTAGLLGTAFGDLATGLTTGFGMALIGVLTVSAMPLRRAVNTAAARIEERLR